MNGSEASGLPHVMRAIAAAAAAYPLQRKLLVCRRTGVGRELLRSLAVRGHGWANIEVTTPRQLAHQLVASDLAAQGLEVADEFEELSLLDAAMDAVLEGAGGRLAELAEGPGLRQAVASSVRALRLAGVTAAELERARFRDEDKRAQIGRILDDYEQRLRDARRVDGAALLARATASLAVGDARLPDALVLLMPGQNRRGLNGALLAALQERGARVLEEDAVHGMAAPVSWLAAPARPDAGATPLSWLHDVPGSHGRGVLEDVDLAVFAATSVTAELREVLRRVVAAGLRWDEVEIIATDTAVYGVALDTLAQRLGIPVTHAAGLPVSRTRPGRAVAKYVEWVQQGLPSDLLRQMLERGDIPAPVVEEAQVSGTALARRLRALQPGRGRDRCLLVLERRLRAVASEVPRDDEERERLARERTELLALQALLQPLLATVPVAADPLQPGTVTPAELAASVLAMLELVPATNAVDRTARTRLVERLQRMARSIGRATSLRAAVAMLLASVEDRVPAPEADGIAPWISAGGRLHLSDLEHGGYASRRATFVVGLDAARFPGGGGSDALLVDDDRRRLTGGQAVPALPTAAERIDEKRYAFAALAARLRGRVTFSYAMWDAVEGRALAPAAELLQAYRLLAGDATADYEALHGATSPPASPVPRAGAPLDGADAWFDALAAPDAMDARDALADGSSLRYGVPVVCAAFPGLQAGVQAVRTRRRRDDAGAHHGLITPRPALDPRVGGQVVSATQLETLGTCAHRFLLRYVLRVRTPESDEATPDAWLPAPRRGRLLHALYEQAVRRAGADGVAFDDDAFGHIVLTLLEELVERERDEYPPASEAVFELERSALREDARAFAAMLAEASPHVLDVEVRFGDGDDMVVVPLPDGSSIRLRGAIDRVDRLEDGRLVVVDYKTGSTARFGGGRGVLDGGRRLQHVLYAAAAERRYGARVATSEYHFPTRRSQNRRIRYAAEVLRDGPARVVDLLELVRNGWFVPTNFADDCRFCDFASVCRTSVDRFGGVTSPMADWSREARNEAAELLRGIRR